MNEQLCIRRRLRNTIYLYFILAVDRYYSKNRVFVFYILDAFRNRINVIRFINKRRQRALYSVDLFIDEIVWKHLVYHGVQPKQ
jgi:hypothetical protein